MSVTKLKTVGSWYAAYADYAASERTNVRGRVITGMLTGGDTSPDTPAVGSEPHRPRTR
jgi:hypothetical protein